MIILAKVFALGFPKILNAAFTLGFSPIEPPTLAIGIGRVSSPFNLFSFSSKIQVVSPSYLPFFAAKVFPPASIARQSFPVAITTASIPLKIPLL